MLRPRSPPTAKAARGLSFNIAALPGMMSVVRIAPPLTVTGEETDRGLAIMDAAMAEAPGAA